MKQPENMCKCVRNAWDVLFIVGKFLAWIALLWRTTYGHTFIALMTFLFSLPTARPLNELDDFKEA